MKTKMPPIYPEPSQVTSENVDKILKVCDKLLDVCSSEQMTISNMQMLPDILSREIQKHINKQVSEIVFVKTN